jgi:hypothetical protein
MFAEGPRRARGNLATDSLVFDLHEAMLAGAPSLNLCVIHISGVLDQIKSRYPRSDQVVGRATSPSMELSYQAVIIRRCNHGRDRAGVERLRWPTGAPLPGFGRDVFRNRPFSSVYAIEKGHFARHQAQRYKIAVGRQEALSINHQPVASAVWAGAMTEDPSIRTDRREQNCRHYAAMRQGRDRIWRNGT